MPKRAVIMVAGGTGTRMASKTAKQFLDLAGKPVIFHTFRAFYRFDPDLQFVLVLYPALREEWQALVRAHRFDIPHVLTHGGAERFHSVKNGLAALDKDVELVAVHDAVRPLVTAATIARSFAAAEKYGAAVPVIPVTDTIRQKENDGSKTLPRHTLVAVQTPQCFRRKVIDEAYAAEYDPVFTDDASVAERAGHYIRLCEGNRANIKITTPEDLAVSEALMASGQNF